MASHSQFSATNGAARRGDPAWITRAMRSFPVPDSPVISTVTSLGATSSASASVLRNAPLIGSGVSEVTPSRTVTT